MPRDILDLIINLETLLKIAQQRRPFDLLVPQGELSP
jgi:hypothetical protein